jgi:hypothetical protein
MAELMQPNIVGNFLNAYQSGLERQEAQKEAERQRMRQDRSDQMAEQRFGMEMDEGELNMALRRGAAMNEILAGVDERNPQTLEIAKQRYLTTFGGKPEDVAQITMADIPRIKLQTGQTLKELELRLKQAQIGTEQDRGRAARALASQRYAAASGGGASAAPGAPMLTGPQDPPRPNIKLTEGQSKDINFYNRALAASTEFTDERVQALTSLKQGITRSVPIVGNLAQSDNSRQAMQVAKNFIAAVLRKDTGAAVTPQEFDFYSDIFIPAPGDDKDTIALKQGARNQFLSSMRSGMSNLAALETMGIVPPENLGPPPPARAANPGAQTSIPRITTKQEFDALPSGALYMEQDGKRYRKP